MTSMPTVEEVADALSKVIDPELGLDFVELGLIYGVEIEGGDVARHVHPDHPGCPIGPQVTEQIEEFVGELPGVDEVEPAHDLRPALVPGQDVRGREVRARLLRPRGRPRAS